MNGTTQRKWSIEHVSRIPQHFYTERVPGEQWTQDRVLAKGFDSAEKAKMFAEENLRGMPVKFAENPSTRD